MHLLQGLKPTCCLVFANHVELQVNSGEIYSFTVPENLPCDTSPVTSDPSQYSVSGNNQTQAFAMLTPEVTGTPTHGRRPNHATASNGRSGLNVASSSAVGRFSIARSGSNSGQEDASYCSESTSDGSFIADNGIYWPGDYCNPASSSYEYASIPANTAGYTTEVSPKTRQAPINLPHENISDTRESLVNSELLSRQYDLVSKYPGQGGQVGCRQQISADFLDSQPQAGHSRSALTPRYAPATSNPDYQLITQAATETSIPRMQGYHTGDVTFTTVGIPATMSTVTAAQPVSQNGWHYSGPIYNGNVDMSCYTQRQSTQHAEASSSGNATYRRLRPYQ